MLDLNSKTLLRRADARAVVEAIDRALVRRRTAEPERTYLGASYIGEACERDIQYRYRQAPIDPARQLTGQALRIFERGHTAEDAMAGWLRLAGFKLETENEVGGQYGFKALDGRFGGHCDGILTGWHGDDPQPIELPALWESKCLNNKGWRSVMTGGLKKAKPVYYAQVQLYMYYLGLTENPCLFTCLNADTQEIHCEMIPFDPAMVQQMLDRAAKVIGATERGELLPRGSSDPDNFMCAFCDFRDRCWGDPP